MYNEELASKILSVLIAAFPRTLQFAQVQESLPEFSTLSPEDWLDAALALRKSGLVSGQFVGSDHSYEPIEVVSLEATVNARRPTFSQEVFAIQAVQPLSKLPDRQARDDDLARLMAQRKLVSLINIDLDGFKSVNDTQGHPAGDRCLEAVVQAIARAAVGKGRVYRCGGDEFAVVLPNFANGEAMATAERVRLEIESGNFGGPTRVTASIGVCSSEQGKFSSATRLVEAADSAMYVSKRGGKNRVSSCV